MTAQAAVAIPQTDDDLTREFLERCAVDRVFFVKNVLGADPDTSWQLPTLEAMDAGETRISIRSGHGVGKTAMCAWLAIHFLLFRVNVKIVVTSPSSSQLKDGLIPEVNLWIRRIPEGFGLAENLRIRAERISKEDDPTNNFISFRTAKIDTPEAIAGIHADNVLVIIDEASGVPEPIYEAGSGTLSTKGAIAVLIGNPTRAKGYFYRTHTKLAEHWWTRRVSCLDVPRAMGHVEDIRLSYGENSSQWRVRVLGEFPTGDEDTVIPRYLAQAMIDREIDTPVDYTTRVWGIDPGRGGDPTGFADRTHDRVVDIQEWHEPDLMRTVGKVKTRWDNTMPSQRPHTIYVDSIGLGAGIADRLRQLDLPAIDVNVSESSSMKDRFIRMRPELWFAVRDWLEARNVTCPSSLKFSEQLVDELCQPEIRLSDSGKTNVETKKELKTRGVASPNLADALCITFAHGGAAQAGRFRNRNWKQAISRKLQGVY